METPEEKTVVEKQEPTPQEKYLDEIGFEKLAVTEPIEKTDEVAEPIVEDEKEKKPEEALLKETPEFDYDKFTAGRVKSKEELDNIFTEHDTIKKEYEPTKKKLTELEAQINELQNKNPFGENEVLYKVHKLAEETGRKDYDFLLKVVATDTATISDLQALETVELLDNSEIYKGKEHLLSRSLMEQYNISKPDDFDDLEPDEQKKINDRIEINEIKMAKDAKIARQRLNDFQTKYKYEKVDPETVKLQMKEKEDKFIEKWRPTTLNIEENFKSIKLNDGDFDYEIPIREEDKAIQQQVLAEMVGYIFTQGLELNDTTVSQVKTLMDERYFALNKKFIIKKIAEQAREMTDAQWKKVVNNTKPLKKEVEPKEITKSPQDLAIERLENEK